MTRVVVALESRGLVTRTPHPTDGRQVIIDLTPAADALLSDEARAREAWLSGQLQQLSSEERAILRDAAVLMDKLASG
jgi:DNA-binding MarR family transcriptional regulator